MPGATASASFVKTTVGAKVIMAITGFFLFGYLCAHVTGNLFIFLGPEYIDAWAHFLHSQTMTFVLWGFRFALLGAILLHVFFAIRLWLLKQAARPVGYAILDRTKKDVASRTMIWTGPLIGCFAVYHVLHLTVGAFDPAFDAHEVNNNVVAGFESLATAAVYVVALMAVGLHLFHGIWSMLQTVGLNDDAYDLKIRIVAAVLSIGIAVGFVSVPVAVGLGILG